MYADGSTLILEEIQVVGNRKTLSNVINNEITLKIGEPFSEAKALETRQRLLNLGFFSSVKLSLKKGSERGKVILLIEIKEHGTILITDLFYPMQDVKNWYGGLAVSEINFLGTGHQLHLAFAAGRDQEGYRIGWYYPHLQSGRGVIGVAGHYVSSKIRFMPEVDPAIPFQRGGITIRAGFKYRGLTKFTAGIRLEQFDLLQTIPFDRTVDLGISSISEKLATLSFGVERDSRDNVFIPRKGNLLSIELQHSSPMFQSDYRYSKVLASSWFYVPVGKFQSFWLGVQGGYVTQDAPFFEKFYLGDYMRTPNSRRYLNVSFEDDRPGEIMAIGSAEYHFHIMRGKGKFLYNWDAFLYADAGTVYFEDFEDWDDIFITTGVGTIMDTFVGRLELAFKLYSDK